MGSERNLNAVDKQARALELLKEGKTYDQIAGQLGYASRSGAHKAVSTALQKTIQEPADELRTLHRIRLQAMWDAIWWAVAKGDPQAIDRALKIMERESKLLGLDMPVRIDVNILREAERIAADNGLDVREVLAEAEQIAKGVA